METSLNKEGTKNYVVYDTSFLVNLGKSDLGALLAKENLKRRLGTRCVEVISRAVAREYTKLFEEVVEDSDGTPKANIDVMDIIYNTPELVQDMPDKVKSLTERLRTRELWMRSSRKALFDRVSTTDLDIVTYARMLAEKGDECFVFSFDEDIIGPLSELEHSGTRVHPMTYTKDSNVSILGKEYPFLFLMEDALRELYNIPSTQLWYMLSTKFSIGDVSGDVVWKIGTSLGGRRLEEGHIKRFPLSIVEVNVESLEERKYRPSVDDFKPDKESVIHSGRTLELLSKMYQECRYFIAARNKNSGLLAFSFYRIGRKTRASAQVEPHDVEWFLLPLNYLTGYQLGCYGGISDKILTHKE